MSYPQLLTVLILAAGKGTRMKSNKAKVLHEVFYSPMIHHVVKAVLPLGPSRTIVIVGHQQDEVRNALGDFPVEFVTQEKQLGTGHAVLATEQSLSDTQGTVMILCGDTPLIQTKTLQEMYDCHKASSATLTLMTTNLDNPTNYGRILIDSDGRLSGIVEEKDTTLEQKAIREINAGIYCVEKAFLYGALHRVGTDNSQGEMYLTDIVALAVTGGHRAERFITSAPHDVLGVNSRVELAAAHKEIQCRRNTELMLQGITMHNPETICVATTSTIGQDTLLMAGVHIQGESTLGESCRIEPGVILQNCILGDKVKIGAYSILENCTLPAETVLAPHSRQFSDAHT